MKNKNITLSLALAAIFSSSVAFAEAEVTGKIIHESGFMTEAGSTIGDYGVGSFGAATGASSGGLNTHAKRDAMKQETTARIYIDGELDELSDGATYHVELNLMTDGKGISKYDSHESYTQRDALREAYVDSQAGDWALRTGKQQVVWGTADGMKLLDMINPTDYGEMAQNQMEDSRIPVWMINAEKDLADGSSVQVILSQPKENVFAGLNRHVDTAVRRNTLVTADGVESSGARDDITLNNGTDNGHAFMMQGPDTITGVYNGFLNIVPDLGGVAARFAGGFGNLQELSAAGMAGFTVGGFEGFRMGGVTSDYKNMPWNMAMYAGGSLLCGGTQTSACSVNTEVSNVNYDGATGGWNFGDLPDGFEQAVSNTGVNLVLMGLIDSTSTADLNTISGAQMLQYGFASQYDTNLADEEVVGEAIDTAFDYMSNTTFLTFDAFVGAGSQYVYNMPTDGEVDLAARFKNTTKDGVNYSLNASYNYDKNPIIDLSWRNSAGTKLFVNKVYDQNSGTLTVLNTTTTGYSLILSDTLLADGSTVTASSYGGYANDYATLRFTQEVKRVLNLGGSFDTAIETETLGPIVIRGEALYTKDTYSPIIDKDKLSYGDLVGALEMVKGNRLKYVLGVDITALTNMMISAQYIEDRNLDFIDGTNRYTADYATMSMSNGFNKAIESKNFYSLFFSKPFGASGEHRWNNITMLEESANGNGKWNRLDAEFSIDDDTQATVEWNRYWGDTNSQFGQLDKTSNIQVGVKYSF